MAWPGTDAAEADLSSLMIDGDMEYDMCDTCHATLAHDGCDMLPCEPDVSDVVAPTFLPSHSCVMLLYFAVFGSEYSPSSCEQVMPFHALDTMPPAYAINRSHAPMTSFR